LRREIEELRASRTRLTLAADVERRDIERALHEGVQQDLVGLATNLEVAARSVDSDPAAAKALLDELQREARRALTETQELANRIFPPLLEEGAVAFEIDVEDDLGPERRAPHDRVEALGGRVTITAGDGRTTVTGSLRLSR
jgi:signal transduction histidine kinase